MYLRLEDSIKIMEHYKLLNSFNLDNFPSLSSTLRFYGDFLFKPTKEITQGREYSLIPYPDVYRYFPISYTPGEAYRLDFFKI